MQIDFYTFSGIFVYGGIVSAIIIFIDTMKRPQEMKIMRPVWILTGLWASYIGLLVYALIGRSDERGNDKMDMGGMDMNMDMSKDEGMQMSVSPVRIAISPTKVALSTLHCGAGCTLADLIGETITMALPLAIAIFVIYGQQLPKNTVEFWFMMQIAMCCGFLTAYPVNWFLIKKGIKPSI